MQRTSAALREVLFEQIEGLKNGSVDHVNAKAIAALANTILKSVEVEMQFRAQQRALADSGEEIGDLPLASLPPPGALRPASLSSPTGPRVVKGHAHSGSA